MKIKNIILATLLTVIIMPASAKTVDKIYSGKGLDHIDYPIGGLGSGMFCISGTGAITNLSFHHYPQLFHEPCAFAAVHVKGIKNGAKVLETSVPDYKIFGRKDGGMGVGGTTWGLPRFEKGTFSTRFPFAEINLSDKNMPLDVNLIAWNPFIPNDEDNIPLVPQSDFDVSPEISENSLPMLYQTGYLTIKSYDERMQLYTLGYPNKEVKIGFTRGLLGEYPSKTGTASGFVAHFYAAMDSQDIDLAMEKLQAYLAGVPNDLENKTEKHYQTIIYLIFSLLGFYIRTEVKSAIGRADAVCYTDNCIYVFEFKVDGSAEDALKQIDDKGYMLPYKFEEGKNLVKVGVNISSQTRTVEKWIAE